VEASAFEPCERKINICKIAMCNKIFVTRDSRQRVVVQLGYLIKMDSGMRWPGGTSVKEERLSLSQLEFLDRLLGIYS
jgi:hypothetical protein